MISRLLKLLDAVFFMNIYSTFTLPITVLSKWPHYLKSNVLYLLQTFCIVQ